MLKIFIYPFSMALILLFLIFTSLSCAEEDSSDIVFAGYHVEKSNAGLEAWNIDLATDSLAHSRSTAYGHQYNPPNWLVLSDSACRGVGIPDSLKSDCPLKDGNVLGNASVEYSPGAISGYFPGEIINTTIMIRESIHNDMSAEEKQSIYTHEIGHALGLRHTDEWALVGNTSHIMFPDTSGADIPCEDELDVISYVYSINPSREPSPDDKVAPCISSKSKEMRTYSEYFSRSIEEEGVLLRHRSKPLFDIYPYSLSSPSSPSFSLSVERPKRGKKLGFTPSVVNFYYYKNGDFKEEYIDGSGKITRSKYIKAGENHFK